MTRDEQFAQDAARIVAAIDAGRAAKLAAERRAYLLFAAAIQQSVGNQEVAEHLLDTIPYRSRGLKPKANP